MDNGTYYGTYIGKSVCGFKKDHNYEFELNKNGYTYELRAFSDNGSIIELYMYYASEISIRSNWIISDSKE